MQERKSAYRAHVDKVLLPFWLDRGVDAATGLFHERLDFSGAPLAAAPRRLMVQARQIYVFADAARVSRDAQAAKIVERAVANLLRCYLDAGDASRGFAFSVSADGRILSEQRDAYGHAFVLFALAAAHRLLGDPALLAVARRTLEFVEQRLFDPADGGMFDVYPNDGALKRQNPLMHLLEAFLALHETDASGVWLDYATRVVSLFRTHLYKGDCRALPEYFAPGWSLPADPARAFFEPGHHFEWVWLLGWHEALGGESHGELRAALWRSACDRGLSPQRLCYDAVALVGAPLKRSTRLWPHGEGVKAAALLATAGDDEAAAVGRDMYRGLFDVFLSRPFAQGWIDHIGEDGAPLVDFVPASSLYHLYCARAEPEWMTRAQAARSAPTSVNRETAN